MLRICYYVVEINLPTYLLTIVNVFNILFPILFADDTNVFIDGHNLSDMCDIVNSEMGKLII